MSYDDVHPDEMDTPDDLDDAAAQALFSGRGREIDPQLADVVADMRMAYVSKPPVVGAELSALMSGSAPAPAPASPHARRSERMRSSILAKVGAATAAIFAATGGLAVAHALPAPVQDAVSHVGIGAPAHRGGHRSAAAATEVTPTSVDPNATTTTVDTATTVPQETTVPGATTPTTAEPGKNHGGAVSDIAHEKDCDHGAVVSNVASNGKAHNEADTDSHGNDDNGKCAAATTLPATTPATTKHDDEGRNDSDGDKGHNGTSPTTVAPAGAAQNGDHGHHGGDGGSGSSGGNRGGNSGGGNN